MTSFVFPALTGLTFDVVRTPVWNTDVQPALSGKRSTVANMGFPLNHFELTFSVLRDDIAFSDTKALVGLFNACKGQYDTFLFTDPDFNTVSFMYFGTGNGSNLLFQIQAAYALPGGAYGQDIIQNFNGTPILYETRYGGLTEFITPYSRSNLLLQSQTFSNASWTKNNMTLSTSATQAPDGTATATDLTDNTTSLVYHNLLQQATVPAVANNIYTASMFLYNVGTFEAPYMWLGLEEQTGFTQATVAINITTGVISNFLTGANWTNLSATYNSLGNGWFRATITATKTNTATGVIFQIFPSTSAFAANYSGTNGAKMATIWGFQLEQATQCSAYLPTTTSVVSITDYTLGPTGVVTMNYAIASTTYLTWSGSFYYRCAFDEDKLDMVKFMNKWWTVKKLPFTTIKL